MNEEGKSYWCLWCMKELKGEPLPNGMGYRFYHDNDKPHPENYAYDEDDHPQ